MHRFMFMAAVLMAGALSLQAAAQQAQQTAADEGMKVTGMVTEVDTDTHEITINDQTFIMPKEGGGASLLPQVGAEITIYYEKKNGQRRSPGSAKRSSSPAGGWGTVPATVAAEP